MDNRPQGRQKNVTGTGKPIGRRGSGLGTGPVGSSGGRPTGSSGSNMGGMGGSPQRPRRSSSGATRAGGSGGGLIKIIAIVLFLLMGGGAGIGNLLGGSGSVTDTIPSTVSTQPTTMGSYGQSSQGSYDPFGFLGGSGSSSQSLSSMLQGFDYSSMFGSAASGTNVSSGSGWTQGSNTGKLNTDVDPAARAKRTQLLGGGKDTVTIMLYMCGTDLESRSAMGTKDLQEMVNATIGSNVNLLVYTGGCRQWRNNIVSSSVNQIYRVKDGGLQCLEKNAGSGAMTSPKTLASFIQYCSKNFPANRNILILWDHGGGSISGYGYDEKSGSGNAMSLKGLDEALSAGKTTFDFIGFDACLMGSLETGLTMAKYADYLIASEETEPGLGWYYTNWLTALSRNTSISTLELGKRIIDDFVSVSAQSCPGQKTTLSLVDLAELERTVPSDFSAFSTSTLKLLKGDGYQTVANARSSAREFASSSKTDQVDVVHMALKIDTAESRALAGTILSAVKYNKTSSDMTNAYGLSLYFPYRKVSGVNNAISAYNAIGMDSSYTACIRAFASMEVGGQAAAGGNTSPMTTLGGQSYGSSTIESDMLTQMLEQLLGGGMGSFGSYSGASSFFDRSLPLDDTAAYLAANRFDPDALVWTDMDGTPVLHMSETQWSMVKDLELNVFVDDGEGYIDLGLDTTFEFTPDGDLMGVYDGSWLAIDGQIVAYYHVDTTVDGDSYTITGRIPVLLNGDRADLIVVFDSETPYGYIAGARTDYRNGETDTIAKGMDALEPGDAVDFLCDYYTYDGEYEDSYYLGDQHIWTGSEEISNVYIPAPTSAVYRVVDIYQNSFWTAVIPEN